MTTLVYGDPKLTGASLATGLAAPPWPRSSGTTISPVPVAAVLAGGVKGTAYSETISAQGGAAALRSPSPQALAADKLLRSIPARE